eukprot:GFUD01108830.1.p1 GENE.GFUD01108830.1~~GFUD01108830.1.p1  ORF type:complete len:338 (+),score=77.87 GFUD01108830.1:110-1123(+)
MECSAAFFEDFLSLLEDSTSSDLMIQNQGEQINVHRAILSARSPVFRAMLRNDMKEKKTGIIEIKDFEMDVIKAMVHYIYTARIDENFDDLKTLAKIGEKYEIQSLVDICCKLLISSISSSNVVDLGVFAETNSFQAVLEKCSQFIASDFGSLGEDWEERVKISPLFMFNILKCLKSSEKEGMVEIVRFSDVSPFAGWACGQAQEAGVQGQGDTLKFQANRASKLCEIGVYGNATTNENIEVDIEVKKGALTVFFKTTNFTSAGNATPVKIPVDVPIEQDTDYTVSVLIKARGGTFFGEHGIGEVENQEFKVCFMNSPHSNGTTTSVGQIPTLVFKI